MAAVPPTPATPAATPGKMSSAGAPTWGDGRPSTSTATLGRSIVSLPDLKSVDRRVAAFKVMCHERVEAVERARDTVVQLAHRRQHEASVFTRREHRSMHRVHSARSLLGTPLKANMTPFEYESHATGRREALRNMHQDCLRREQISQRQQLAHKEALLAQDTAEQLGFERQQEAFRVDSKKQQEHEWVAHRRYLQRRRKQELNMEAELAERHAEKAHRVRLREEAAAKVRAGCAARRAHKEAMEKDRLLEEKQSAARREDAAAFKARKLAFAKSLVAHGQQCDYAKRLEKAWKHADGVSSQGPEP